MMTKDVVKLVLVLVLIVGILVIVTPVGQAEGAVQPPTGNGDGVLSVAERSALNAVPVAEVTAETLADVRGADLPRLDADLRRLITTPVSQTYESSPVQELTARCGRGNPCRARGWHTWREENAIGWTLYTYRIGISWTYNMRRVWDFDSSHQTTSHWGWHNCDISPRGEEWIGSRQTGRKAYGFARFGHFLVNQGCVLSPGRILGGSVTGYYNGVAFYRNGSCCD